MHLSTIYLETSPPIRLMDFEIILQELYQYC